MDDKRVFKGPVAWLGGRDLLANLKYFVLFAISSGKMDVRDWMTGSVYPPQSAAPDDSLVEFWKRYRGDRENEDEFWFDYIADSGDGMKATYSVAYMCLSDIFII